MNKVCILIFFFGKFPWYHNLFIESCKKNSFIDFYIFSDEYDKFRQIGNIFEYPFSIEEFNKLASEKLGMKICVHYGMKICDLRPAFGIIFSNFLKSYEFWGYSDTDIIFGRLDKFLTPKLFERFDYVSVKKYFPSGFFSIYRNDKTTNNLFRQNASFIDQVSKDYNTLFEECGGYYDEVIRGVNILETDCPFDTIHHLLERNKLKIRSLFRDLSYENLLGKIKLTNSVLTYKGTEIMMYHLSRFKKSYFFKVPNRNLTGKNLLIFKHSIRQATVINYLKGNFIDLKNIIFMILSDFLDKRVKLIPKKFDIEGVYHYMSHIYEFQKDHDKYFLIYKNQTFPIYQSLLQKQLFYINGLNSYIKKKDNNNITLIFLDGDTFNLYRKRVCC